MSTIPNEEKVFMVSNGTNTTYSGSASLKAMQEWYTMQDVTDTVKPYKVCTALLFQDGGNDPASMTEGFLKIGRTYYIASSGAGDDFSNVGGPKITFNEEWVGTYFVATGDIPANWTNDTELAYNNGAPEALVLENSIGDIWFTYEAVGFYGINSNSLFTEKKTIILQDQQTNKNSSDLEYYIHVDYIETYFTGLSTSLINTTSTNGALRSTPIEIRVYN